MGSTRKWLVWGVHNTRNNISIVIKDFRCGRIVIRLVRLDRENRITSIVFPVRLDHMLIHMDDRLHLLLDDQRCLLATLGLVDFSLSFGHRADFLDEDTVLLAN